MMMKQAMVKQKIRDRNGNYIEVLTEEYAIKSCKFTIAGTEFLITGSYVTGDKYRDVKHDLKWQENGENKYATVTHQYLIDAFLKQQK